MAITRKHAALVLIAMLALGSGVLIGRVWLGSPPAPVLASGILLPQPRAVAAFTLVDQDGAAFTQERLRGHWTLVFAGFTHCPDVCPTTLQLLRQLELRMGQQQRAVQAPLQAPLQTPLQIVFLSLDPQRDPPDRLLPYVRYFSPSLTGVTGTQEQIERFSTNLGLAYVKVPGATDTEYTIDHSSALVLLNPDAAIAGYFQAPHKLDMLSADLERVIAPAS